MVLLATVSPLDGVRRLCLNKRSLVLSTRQRKN
jgi:hypothetical protein